MKYLVLIAFILSFSLNVYCKGENEKLKKKASRIHNKVLTIDTHNDTPFLLLEKGFNITEKHEAPYSRVDFPRMIEGGLDAMFIGVFTSQKPRSESTYNTAYNIANQMLDSIHSVLDQFPDWAELAIKSGDAERISQKGKRAIYIGMENGFPLAKKLERVEGFYSRGVRYITLCHSFHNDICDSSSDIKEPEHGGLSEFGKKVVREMNRLGMMIDVSHMSDESFFQVIEHSKAPVMASHSSVRSVCNHDRNMSDKMIKALAENGGVIQICLLDDYVKEPDTTTQRYQEESRLMKIYRSQYPSMSDDEKKSFSKEWREMKKLPKNLPTVSDLVDHIDYVVDLVGVDFVGIGSDFDGGGGLADCADVSEFPNITYELVKRGYTEKDIQKIWGQNLLRVFREVEKTAARID